MDRTVRARWASCYPVSFELLLHYIDVLTACGMETYFQKYAGVLKRRPPSRYLLSVPQFCEQNPAFTSHVTPCYLSYMLHSFRDKDTEALFNGQRVRRFEAVKTQAERRPHI